MYFEHRSMKTPLPSGRVPSDMPSKRQGKGGKDQGKGGKGGKGEGKRLWDKKGFKGGWWNSGILLLSC